MNKADVGKVLAVAMAIDARLGAADESAFRATHKNFVTVGSAITTSISIATFINVAHNFTHVD